MTPTDWDIPGVRQGMTRMMDRRESALARGERHIGWKLAFGAPTALARFGLSGPVVGYLTDATMHPPGSTVSCEGWARPVAEPELAVRFGRDVTTPGEADSAVSEFGLAIELANVDPPPEEIEDVLAGNIYHQAVLFGETVPVEDAIHVTDLGLAVKRVGHDVVNVADVEKLTGRVGEVLVHAAGLLAAAGSKFRSGDVVILGSVTPPLEIAPGEEVTFTSTVLDPVIVGV